MKRSGDGRRGFRGAIRGLVVGTLAVLSVGAVAVAQVGGISAEQLQQLQQQRSGGTTPTLQPSVTPRETILEPTAPSAPQPPSEIERILSVRAGVRLQMYGYDQLGVGRSVSLPQIGAVQDDYVLGVGDEVVLTLRGQENNEYRVLVDRDGNVTFPRLNPISAAGRTLGKFRENLQGSIRRAYVATEGFVTVGRIRQISVLVSGEVGSPGVRTLTGLSSVVDAIFVSGGVKKSGSLRNILVQRGGRTLVVDLYSVLTGNVRSKNIILADGDKVVVPPLGGTIAVAGQVRRPGIYELPAGRAGIGVREAVNLASGKTLPGSYTISLLRMQPDGKRQLVDVSTDGGYILHDGEIVLVKSAVNISTNQVKLMGAVRSPGTVALGKFKTLHDVLPSTDVLNPGAYMLMGIIDRTDPVTLQRIALPFSPLQVIQGRADQKLVSNDTIRILTKDEMLRLVAMSPAGRQQFAGGTDVTDQIGTPSQSSAAASENFAKAADAALVSRDTDKSTTVKDTTQVVLKPLPSAKAGLPSAFPQAGQVPQRGPQDQQQQQQQIGQPVPSTNPASQSDDDFVTPEPGPTLTVEDALFYATYLSEDWVTVNGPVKFPGTYLVAPQTSLADVLRCIGGFTSDADRGEFEITSTSIDNVNGLSSTARTRHSASDDELARVIVQRFDRVEFHRVDSDKMSGSVTLGGEVRFPGVYSILRNEKLSSVIERAGGLNDVAFPEGTVFLRLSVAKAEEVENKRIAADMREQLLHFLMKPAQGGSQPPTAEGIAAIEGLISRIDNTTTLGRVPVVAEMATLKQHPELDTVLEPGDSIVVPKRPSTVLVMGEVLRPGAARYVASDSVDDYLEKAGGTTSQADTSRVIIVLPDGSVRSNSSSWLNFGFGSRIPAGSTIFVPRELEYYTVRQFVTDTIQIFGQLATSAAALAVLSKQ